MATSPVIRVERLHKRFGPREVLSGLSLELHPGQVVGLLGTNGSGKSTLIKCLLGLLKPTSGVCEVLSEPSWELTAAVKERIGHVPQEVTLLPWMTVQGHADYVGAFYQHWNARRVGELIRNWGLDPKQLVGKLSVGQRQKFASILALGHDPEVLVFDEPVASLDPAARRQFLQELIELAQDERHTVLFSTHITSDVERVASHVALMGEGQIEFFGELDELKDRIKRVRLTRAEPFSSVWQCPEAIRSKVDGPHAVLSIDQQRCDLNSLASRYDASVQIENLNLEEIFLELCAEGSSTGNLSLAAQSEGTR